MDKVMWICFICSSKIYRMYLKSLNWNRTLKQKKLPLRDFKAATPGRADCLKLLCVSTSVSITLILNVNVCVASIVNTSYELWNVSHRINGCQEGYGCKDWEELAVFFGDTAMDERRMKERCFLILWSYAQLYLERGEFCLGLCRC